jgi:ABC-2 type transport system ATP-binding protein
MAISVEHLADSTTCRSRSGGEIVGLIGPNVRERRPRCDHLAGILRPTAGHVRIDGYDTVEHAIEAKRRLAFMPDEPHLFE